MYIGHLQKHLEENICLLTSHLEHFPGKKGGCLIWMYYLLSPCRKYTVIIKLTKEGGPFISGYHSFLFKKMLQLIPPTPFIYLLFFFNLAVPQMWDLSSPTWDEICSPDGSIESQPLWPGKPLP